MSEADLVNPACLVNCQGCNAELCCWDMAREDFEEGRQCNCTVFDGDPTKKEPNNG